MLLFFKIDQATIDNIGNVANEVSTHLNEAGVPFLLTMENKMQAIASIYLHYIISLRKGEIDQFAAGLGPILSLIKHNPQQCQPLFVAPKDN